MTEPSSSAPPPSRSTHWSAQPEPERWNDNPLEDPTEAAEQYLSDDDCDAWQEREDLIHDGRCTVTLHGFRHTADPLDPETAFDGYEPGQEYYSATGEVRTATIRRTIELGRVESKP